MNQPSWVGIVARMCGALAAHLHACARATTSLPSRPRVWQCPFYLCMHGFPFTALCYHSLAAAIAAAKVARRAHRGA